MHAFSFNKKKDTASLLYFITLYFTVQHNTYNYSKWLLSYKKVDHFTNEPNPKESKRALNLFHKNKFIKRFSIHLIKLSVSVHLL